MTEENPLKLTLKKFLLKQKTTNNSIEIDRLSNNSLHLLYFLKSLLLDEMQSIDRRFGGNFEHKGKYLFLLIKYNLPNVSCIIDDGNKMEIELKNMILWIFGRQLFYKLLKNEANAKQFLQSKLERLDFNLLASKDESSASAETSARNEHNGCKIIKLVDSEILLEMLRIFDFFARFFVRSFFSNTLKLGTKEGDNHATCFFKTTTSRMNLFLIVSVGFHKENIADWNLKGRQKLS